jgi:hypothetical protein
MNDRMGAFKDSDDVNKNSFNRSAILRLIKHNENMGYPISPAESKEEVSDRRENISRKQGKNQFNNEE